MALSALSASGFRTFETRDQCRAWLATGFKVPRSACVQSKCKRSQKISTRHKKIIMFNQMEKGEFTQQGYKHSSGS